MEIADIATIVGLGVLVQFVAAILGPRLLGFFSFLMFMGSLAAVAYLLHQAYSANFGGIGADALELATGFGILAAAFGISHLLMRALFRCMARYSRAAA